MLNWLKSFFTRTEKYIIIEIDKAIGKVPTLTQEIRDSVKSLQYHPGFVYLQKKFHAERAYLETLLHEGHTLSERELHHLQAGIHYLSYLDSELKKMFVDIPKNNTRSAYDDEVDAFERIRSHVETIGQ